MRVIRSFEHGLSLITPTKGYDRTPGLHASEIYNKLYAQLEPKRYDRRDAKGKPLPMPEDRVGFGTRFEEALEPELAQKYRGHRPGEFAVQHDELCVRRGTPVKVGDAVCPCGAGIIYSPDYFFFLPGEAILGEFKLTWMSSKDFPHDKKFDKWKTQVKFYGRNLKMYKVWVFPFWVNGGTKERYHNCQPEFDLAWELEFTPRECEQTHKMLIRFAREQKMLPVAA